MKVEGGVKCYGALLSDCNVKGILFKLLLLVSGFVMLASSAGLAAGQGVGELGSWFVLLLLHFAAPFCKAG